MIVDSLKEFVGQLEDAGELVRIQKPVSVVREVTEIADRCMKSAGGGPALLFEQPVLQNGKIADIPLGINLFGSMRRMEMALGVENLDVIGDRISQLLQTKVPEGIREKLKTLSRVAEIAKFPPKTMKSGKPACQHVILEGSEADVTKLPNITCWPGDGGAYITLPQVISVDPRTGVRNVVSCAGIGTFAFSDALAASQSWSCALARHGRTR